MIVLRSGVAMRTPHVSMALVSSVVPHLTMLSRSPASVTKKGNVIRGRRAALGHPLRMVPPCASQELAAFLHAGKVQRGDPSKVRGKFAPSYSLGMGRGSRRGNWTGATPPPPRPLLGPRLIRSLGKPFHHKKSPSRKLPILEKYKTPKYLFLAHLTF